jgi:hypothetical protein
LKTAFDYIRTEEVFQACVFYAETPLTDLIFSPVSSRRFSHVRLTRYMAATGNDLALALDL